MASISDDFNRAALNVGGPFTWTSAYGSGTWAIITNELNLAIGGTNYCKLRAESDMASVNHYAQITIPNSENVIHGPCVRFAAAADTQYVFLWRNSQAQWEIWKFVTGTLTVLFTGAGTQAGGDVMYLEDDSGNNLTGKIGGVTKVGPSADASITTNTLTAVLGVDSESITYDDFSAADLAAGGGTRIGVAA